MIKLTEQQAKILYNNFDRDISKHKMVEGYEGWTIEPDTDTGDFDSEKGFMYDFELYLYDEKGKLRGTAIGGTYYQGEVRFEEEYYEFEAPTSLEEFNKYLVEVSKKALNASNDIAEMEAKLKLIAGYITGIRIERGTKEY